MLAFSILPVMFLQDSDYDVKLEPQVLCVKAVLMLGA